MARHRDIPVIVSPSDLRAREVSREVAAAVRSGRARYVGLSEGEARRLLDARLATLRPRVEVEGVDGVRLAFAAFGRRG
ncbi:hypothetical protein [Methylorubrum suomiense]|uniref:Uncharacterized protein n=1 Tax=Methylorubrum suomiense TaxID=144191 RepID=A0ABQ4US00_9HYPH|nr:hypothetical protein [Methylorubrum suomiense]GJE74953.1 hypothetical protein BGCPKDLD_1527 [Methylorubrum suomiense]